MYTNTHITDTSRAVLAPGTRIFFCGIGGAGMNPLAHVLARRGLRVSGADAAGQKALAVLRAAGIPCAAGHDASLVDDADVFVYSAAIAPDNPQWLRAQARGIPCLRRGQLLALLVNRMRGVTVAATHGKTTTSALTALLFEAAGLDPLALIGGDVPAFGGYFRDGHSEWIVVESDESDGSFELLDSQIALVLNIDADHMDFYPHVDAISAAFARYLARVRPDGALIYNADDARVAALARDARHIATRISCALDAPADVTAHDIVLEPWSSSFTVSLPCESVRITLGLPGRHNISNALHAIAAARYAGAELEAIQRACAAFHGVRRRMELLGTYRGALVIDDYAHHPREIAATVAAVRLLGRPLIVVFQPHRYTRTAALLDEFVTVLAPLERVIITDVFSASEPPGPVTGATLFEAVKRFVPAAQFAPTLDAIRPALARMTKPDDVILFLGAGSISAAAHALVDAPEQAA